MNIDLNNGYSITFTGKYNRVPIVELSIKELDNELYCLKMSMNNMASLIISLSNKIDTTFITSMNDIIQVIGGPNPQIIINKHITLDMDNNHIGLLVDCFTDFVSKM